MADFIFWTRVTYDGFWTLMADFGFWTLVTDLTFWTLVSDFAISGRFGILDGGGRF